MHKLSLAIILLVSLLSSKISTIDDIKAEYKKIHANQNSYKTKDKFIDGISAEGAKATYFYNKNSLKLIKIQIFGEMGKEESEYYFNDNNPFFIYSADTNYNTPMYAKEFKQKLSKTDRKRLYFINNKLVKYLLNKKEISKSSKQFKQEEINTINFLTSTLKIPYSLERKNRIVLITKEDEGRETVMLKRLNQNRTIWTRVIEKTNPGPIETTKPISLKENIVVAGHTTYAGTGESYFWIKAINQKGKIIWSKKVNALPQSQLISLEKSSDNKIVFKALKDENKPFKIKLDMDGKVLSVSK